MSTHELATPMVLVQSMSCQMCFPCGRALRSNAFSLRNDDFSPLSSFFFYYVCDATVVYHFFLSYSIVSLSLVINLTHILIDQ